MACQLRCGWGSHLHGWNTVAVAISEEENGFAVALGFSSGLDPQTYTLVPPQRFEKSYESTFDIGSVMHAHDGFDSLRGFVSVVEGNRGHKVMEDMSLHNSMHEMSTDEAHLSVNGRGGTTGEIPNVILVMRQCGVCMLEVCDSNYINVSLEVSRPHGRSSLPSQ